MGGPAVPGARGSRLPAGQRVPRPGDGDTADQARQLRHTARQQALLFVTKLCVILSPIFLLNYCKNFHSFLFCSNCNDQFPILSNGSPTSPPLLPEPVKQIELLLNVHFI